MKFKIGDLIKGNPGSKSHYSRTNEYSTCKVLKIDSSKNEIKIEIMEHSNMSYTIGETYYVTASYFMLVKPCKPINLKQLLS